MPSTQSRSSETFAGIVLVAPFRTLPLLLQHYRISGLLPVLKPLQAYPKIANFLASRIVDTWATLPRLTALVAADRSRETGFHIALLHARNDQDIAYYEAELLFEPLQRVMLGSASSASKGQAGDAADDENDVSAEEVRRSIHGGDRVKRGAFAYKKVEDSRGERVVELEVTRYGGHNEVVGWSQVGLAVRRAFEKSARKRSLKPGFDVE